MPGTDITAAAAAALADTDPSTTARQLQQLSAVHLLDEHALDRYTLHDLLREYAAERATEEEPAADCRTARDRLYEYLQRNAAAAAAGMLYPELLRLPSADPAGPDRTRRDASPAR
jgi:hypothetical protein